MKILITGGAGFVGSHLVDSLLARKHEIIVIDNLSTGRKEFLNNNAKFYNADICYFNSINEIFRKEKPEMVIHAAAQVMIRVSFDKPDIDAKINIIGTINILEACRLNKIKKIIYTSTGGARIGFPKYLPVDENHPLNPTSPYGISKHTAEHYVEMYAKLYDMDYKIFCFGNVYGPRDNPQCKRVTAVFCYLMINGKQPHIFGDGNQTRDFIYVKDLAELIADSITKNTEHHLFHVANGTQVSVIEIFNILKNLSGFVQHPIHDAAIKGEIRDIVLDTKLVQKELNWKPRHDMASGLKETYAWMKENHKMFKLDE